MLEGSRLEFDSRFCYIIMRSSPTLYYALQSRLPATRASRNTYMNVLHIEGNRVELPAGVHHSRSLDIPHPGLLS